MITPVFYVPEKAAAIQAATDVLIQKGLRFAQVPDPSVTHLLLSVPSFSPNGSFKDGGRPGELLPLLPKDICIIGGNLGIPVLDAYSKLDLLQDPVYLAENARLTAECALRILGEQLQTSIFGCDILIIGWGRIGKCLAQLLRSMGARVVVAARKSADLGMLRALGYAAIAMSAIPDILPQMRVLINTAPAMVLENTGNFSGLKLDLASVKGIAGEDVVWARGLPGKMLPEASGALIARRVLTLLYSREGQP